MKNNIYLKSGHFNLFPIYNFAAITPKLPESNSNEQKKYREVIKNLVKDIPDDKPGWYLWGKFNSMGWWETIYLGKAGKARTSSLYTRLYDELREENIAFWSHVFGSEVTVKQASKLSNGIYINQIPRSLRKEGSQFVIWISVESEITEEEINIQEEILIKVYRPTHNHRRSGSARHTPFTDEIESMIECEIESILKI